MPTPRPIDPNGPPEPPEVPARVVEGDPAPAVFALASDKNKTPVNIAEQPVGTKLVALLAHGRDIPITVTGAHVAAPGAVATTIAKYKGKAEQ